MGLPVTMRRRAQRAQDGRNGGRNDQSAGGAWLGAGPLGVRQTAGVHGPEGLGASARAAATATACGLARRPAETTVACAAASACVQLAAAAHEASGIAPAGERPTSTAAHAAARETRIPSLLRPSPADAGSSTSLSPARELSTSNTA